MWTRKVLHRSQRRTFIFKGRRRLRWVWNWAVLESLATGIINHKLSIQCANICAHHKTYAIIWITNIVKWRRSFIECASGVILRLNKWEGIGLSLTYTHWHLSLCVSIDSVLHLVYLRVCMPFLQLILTSTSHRSLRLFIARTLERLRGLESSNKISSFSKQPSISLLSDIWCTRRFQAGKGFHRHFRTPFANSLSH